MRKAERRGERVILDGNAIGMQRQERGEMVERSGEKIFPQKQGNRGVERS